jgi:hypothetical protein
VLQRASLLDTVSGRRRVHGNDVFPLDSRTRIKLYEHFFGLQAMRDTNLHRRDSNDVLAVSSTKVVIGTFPHPSKSINDFVRDPAAEIVLFPDPRFDFGVAERPLFAPKSRARTPCVRARATLSPSEVEVRSAWH